MEDLPTLWQRGPLTVPGYVLPHQRCETDIVHDIASGADERAFDTRLM